MTLRPRQLVSRASLGLPYNETQYLKRALMHLPWRMFVGRQVDFNREVAASVGDLTRRVRASERRQKELNEGLARVSAALLAVEQGLRDLSGSVESGFAQHRESAAIAVREQLYDVEGAIRSELSSLQIELARLAPESPSS